MRILELTTYSAGSCGVGARVMQESRLLTEKGHEVRIFSTNHTKGCEEIAPEQELVDNVKIQRFPAKKLGGESFTYWNFKKAALEYSPDIIIAHAYRHTHTTNAIKVAKKLNIPVLLVTHAPFDTGTEKRTFLSKIALYIYDSLVGPKTLKGFSKIIIIAPWEKEALKKLNVPESKIEYIPNGIPESFFTKKKSKEQNKILFFGRISPVKNIETLIEAMLLIKNKKTILEIVGPAEEEYLKKLQKIIVEKNLEKRVLFSSAIYDISKKIEKIDSAKVFVLPSIREGMPQGLIEAMAREKIVIASDNLGSSSLIKNNRNGFLFPIGDSKALAKLIDKALSTDNKKMRKAALSSVKQFNWEIIIERLYLLINSLVKID